MDNSLLAVRDINHKYIVVEERRNVIIMNPDNLEIVKLTISILSIVATSIFSLVTIIITCHNANKQVKESEKALKQQEEQYKKEKLYDKEIIRIQKKTVFSC